MCISAGLRLLCIIITDDVWLRRELYGAHEHEEKNKEMKEEEEGVKGDTGGDRDAHIIKSTVKSLVGLCNVLDEQYSNRDEMVRMLRTQGQVTLSLLLQASPLAKKHFMASRHFSEDSEEKVRALHEMLFSLYLSFSSSSSSSISSLSLFSSPFSSSSSFFFFFSFVFFSSSFLLCLHFLLLFLPCLLFLLLFRLSLLFLSLFPFLLLLLLLLYLHLISRPCFYHS